MTMEQYNKMRIPSEVFKFFTSPGGHSMIVRGMAGAGKTTFALQVIEEMANVERGYYFSTRVSDSALLQHFPWLAEKYLGRNSPNERKEGEALVRNRSGLSRMKGLGIQQVGSAKKEMSITIGKDLGDIEGLYELVEKNLPERTLVVIDSIDALAERYNMSYSSLIASLQKDLVEGYGSNVLYVLENTDQSLDYLGDAVVIVSRSEFNRRRVREIEILKLRGCEIQQPKYLFTLKGGRIQAFGYGNDSRSLSQNVWVLVEDQNGRVSSGLMDLDRLTNGGLEKGTMTLIQLGEGVPSNISGLIEQSLVANFVAQRRGVLWVPMRKSGAEAMRAQMANLVSKDSFEKCVRIPEIAAMVETSAPYVMPVEGANATTDLKWRTISYSLSGTEAPMLSLLGFDTLESIYGEEVMDDMPEHLGAVKRNKGVCVCITSPSSRSTHKLSDLANVHLKADRIGGTIVIYAEEPFTECNALALEERPKGGNISLTPIV